LHPRVMSASLLRFGVRACVLTLALVLVSHALSLLLSISTALVRLVFLMLLSSVVLSILSPSAARLLLRVLLRLTVTAVTSASTSSAPSTLTLCLGLLTVIFVPISAALTATASPTPAWPTIFLRCLILHVGTAFVVMSLVASVITCVLVRCRLVIGSAISRLLPLGAIIIFVVALILTATTSVMVAVAATTALLVPTPAVLQSGVFFLVAALGLIFALLPTKFFLFFVHLRGRLSATAALVPWPSCVFVSVSATSSTAISVIQPIASSSLPGLSTGIVDLLALTLNLNVTALLRRISVLVVSCAVSRLLGSRGF